MSNEPLSTYLPEAIEQAVTDLRRLRGDPRFSVSTYDWARYDKRSDVCYVSTRLGCCTSRAGTLVIS